MAPKAVVGPVLADLDDIGGGNVTLATAFYSAGALNALNLKVDNLRLLVRLDTSSVFEWAARAIDPVALCDFGGCNEQGCSGTPHERTAAATHRRRAKSVREQGKRRP